MKKRFEQYFQFFPESLPRSTLLYGTNQSYLNFCTELLCERLRNVKEKVVIEKHTQSRLLDQPQLLSNSGDLFSPAAKMKFFIVSDSSDRSVKIIEQVLEKDPTIYFIFSCLVGSVKKLKSVHETSQNTVLLGCYLDAPEERKFFLKSLTQKNALRFSPELKRHIFTRFDEYSHTLAENFQKLALYQGGGDSELNIEDWKTCCHSFMEGQVTQLALAVADCNRGELVKMLRAVEEGGVDEMQILRGVLSHFHKLLQLKAEVVRGKSVREAVSQSRPLIFFKNQPRYQAHLQRWTTPQLLQAIDKLVEVEKKLKKGFQGIYAATHHICLDIACLRSKA